MKRNERKELILAALVSRGGRATTRQIAEDLELNVNGVAQTLGVMSETVRYAGGRGGETRWEIRREDRPVPDRPTAEAKPAPDLFERST